MHCSEARLRITGSRRDIKNYPELQEHLKNCPACAKEFEAAHVLIDIFDLNSKNDTSDMIPLETQLKFVQARVENKDHLGSSGVLKNSLFGHRLSFGISALATAAVLLLFAVIPFNYEQVVGYEILFRGIDLELVKERTTICDVLFNLGLEEADIDFLGCDTTCNITVQYLKSEDEVKMVLFAFSEINDYDLSSHVIPIHSQSSRSLLEKVDEKIF